MFNRTMLYVLSIIITMIFFNACSNNDYIIKINNETILKQEFDLYLLKGKEYFESQGGEDIWQTKIDGEDAKTVLKNSVLDTVIRTKIQAAVAKKKNINLDVEEKKQLNDTVEKYIEQANSKKRFSRENVEKFVRDNMIVVKLYNSETQNVEITDQMFNDYLKENGNNSTSDISNEEREKIKEDFYNSKRNELFEQKYNEWKKEYRIEINNKELNEIVIVENGKRE
ncbi:MAG TPA: hypothetical protein DEG71_02190 [Clostridiales bacterium]|nr:hypothetical protein [Clostridiales bacterium]